MYKKNKRRQKTISCGAVTWRLNNGNVEILLIKQFKDSDSWRIPKGHIDDGESFEECAMREVSEETGINIRVGHRLPDCRVLLKAEDKTVVSFIATPIDDHDIKHDDPDNEVVDARWINVDALPKIHAYQRSLITSAIEFIKSIVAYKN